jgi:hypothetical protein
MTKPSRFPDLLADVGAFIRMLAVVVVIGVVALPFWVVSQ